jgi:hypothetical protein
MTESGQAGNKGGGSDSRGAGKSSIEAQLEENSRYRDSPNQELVFYYSRERRLARASEAVRAINEPGPAMKGGLVRVLFATRAGIVLFITIAVLCAFILFVHYTRGRPDLQIAGNQLSISALGYSGSTYVEIRKKALGDDGYTGAVDLALSIPQKLVDAETAAPIVNRRIFFTLEGQEEFRFSLPFDAPELILLVQAGDEIVSFQVKVTAENIR